MANKVKVDPRYLGYDTSEVESLLDETKNRSFLVDITEDEYETLPKAEKENGNLYLLHEADE